MKRFKLYLNNGVEKTIEATDYNMALDAANEYAKQNGTSVKSVIDIKQEALDYNKKVNADIESGKIASDVYKAENPNISEWFPHLGATPNDRADTGLFSGWIPSGADVQNAQKDVWSLPGRLLVGGADKFLGSGDFTLGKTTENDKYANFLRSPELFPFMLASAALAPAAVAGGFSSYGIPGAMLAGGLTEAGLGAGTKLALGDPKAPASDYLKEGAINLLGGGAGAGLQARNLVKGIDEMFPKASSVGQEYITNKTAGSAFGNPEVKVPFTNKTIVEGNPPQTAYDVVNQLDKESRLANLSKKYIDEKIPQVSVGTNELLPSQAGVFNSPTGNIIPIKAIAQPSNNIVGNVLPGNVNAAIAEIGVHPQAAVNDYTANLLSRVYDSLKNEVMDGSYDPKLLKQTIDNIVDGAKKEITASGKEMPSKEFNKATKGNALWSDVKDAFEEATGVKFPVDIRGKANLPYDASKLPKSVTKQLELADFNARAGMVESAELNTAAKNVKEYVEKQLNKHVATTKENTKKAVVKPIYTEDDLRPYVKGETLTDEEKFKDMIVKRILGGTDVESEELAEAIANNPFMFSNEGKFGKIADKAVQASNKSQTRLDRLIPKTVNPKTKELENNVPNWLKEYAPKNDTRYNVSNIKNFPRIITSLLGGFPNVRRGAQFAGSSYSNTEKQ